MKRNIIAQRFFNDFASSYEDLTSKFDYSLFDITKNIYEKNNIKEGSILDVGCGTGKLKTKLGDNFIYTGIDFSHAMLAIAGDKGYKTIEGAIEEIIFDIKDKSYDHVLILSVLYFIKDIEKIIDKLERIGRKSLIVGFEKFSDKQLTLVYEGYEGVKRYNHDYSIIKNPTDVLKGKLFWKYNENDKVYGDVVFKLFR